MAVHEMEGRYNYSKPKHSPRETVERTRQVNAETVERQFRSTLVVLLEVMMQRDPDGTRELVYRMTKKTV